MTEMGDSRMSKWVFKACCMASMAVAVAGLTACNRQADADPALNASAQAGQQFAQVVSVTPVHQTVNTPQQVCQDVVVNHTAPPKDQHNIAGTAIGAVAGGLLGHLVGHGRGNTLATVAGAAAGGYAGNRIEASHHQAQVVSTTRHECQTVNNTADTIVGYDVQYVYNGVTRTARMDHDPGNQVQVQEGVVAVSGAQ